MGCRGDEEMVSRPVALRGLLAEGGIWVLANWSSGSGELEFFARDANERGSEIERPKLGAAGLNGPEKVVKKG